MNAQLLRHDKQCRLCGSPRITTVMELEDTPLEDQFVRKEGLAIAQPIYPLALALCDSCGYLHLPHIVSPEASYADYVYESGVTVGLRNHYDQYAHEVVSTYKIPKGSFAVDLGSNDGSMLAALIRCGLKAVGVEPASRIAQQANDAGLPTINGFFTEETASGLLATYGEAQVVTANYMYANIDNVIAFTKSVASILAPDGVFVVQTGYHPEQMKVNMFDYIYHEHFSYFTVEVLATVFAACGLELIGAEKTTPKGGSIRVVGQRTGGARLIDPSVSSLIEEEQQLGMRKPETYRMFAQGILNAKQHLVSLLRDLKAQGKSVVGLGASHSTTTLLYHFELAPFLDYLVDDNPLKHGRYSPGHHIPVYSTTKLYEIKPDYVLVLAWQHQTSILGKHAQYLKNNGKWIVPLPQLKVLGMDQVA
jgi:SAM-dependent methyltransferase